jgi:hypothetical protein
MIRQELWKGNRKCGRENGTGYTVTSKMVLSAHEVVWYTNINIRNNVITFGDPVFSVVLVSQPLM